jgi:hypothetical protein
VAPPLAARSEVFVIGSLPFDRLHQRVLRGADLGQRQLHDVGLVDSAEVIEQRWEPQV